MAVAGLSRVKLGTIKGITALSDSELRTRYLETGESSYFGLLYDRYAQKVYAKCISILKDEALAQDATQEIFVKIFVNLAKFNERAKISTWIYSITYNFCIDLIRRDKKMKFLFSDDMQQVPEPVEEITDEQLLSMEIDRLKIVLEEIPLDDKLVLLMKYQDDLQIRDIALALNKTESAIKMKLKRAKHKAQRTYESLFPMPLE